MSGKPRWSAASIPERLYEGTRVRLVDDSRHRSEGVTISIVKNPQAHPLCRPRDHRLVAGVASGVGRHLGVSTVAVRIAFVLLLAFPQLGLLLYVALWAVLREEQPPDAPWPPHGLRAMLPFFALGLGVMVMSSLIWPADIAGWLVTAIVVGASMVWNRAAPADRQRWGVTVQSQSSGQVVAGSVRSAFPLPRLLGGGILVVVAIRGGGVSVVAILVGTGVMMALVMWQIIRELRSEREKRFCERQCAELAATIQDQTLQTLALIQRNHEDVETLRRLARDQEHSLRNWLVRKTIWSRGIE